MAIVEARIAVGSDDERNRPLPVPFPDAQLAAAAVTRRPVVRIGIDVEAIVPSLGPREREESSATVNRHRCVRPLPRCDQQPPFVPVGDSDRVGWDAPSREADRPRAYLVTPELSEERVNLVWLGKQADDPTAVAAHITHRARHSDSAARR